MLYIVIVIHQHHRRRRQSQVVRNVQFNHETKNEKVNRLEKKANICVHTEHQTSCHNTPSILRVGLRSGSPPEDDDHWFHEYGSIVFIVITLLSRLYLHNAALRRATQSHFTENGALILIVGGKMKRRLIWGELKTGLARMVCWLTETSVKK